MSENNRKRVTLAYGDGIGPEIMQATVRVMEAANVPVDFDVIEIGQSVYEQGVQSGISADAWETLRKNRVLLKGPVSTPQGRGFQSVNVTIRKSLGLFANVRQCRSYSPYVASAHPGMNMTIIRENEEDLYAGIEYRQTHEVTQVLKLVSRPGTESIIRYAFEYARAYGRRWVTCMTKDNIMKMSDGLFHHIFDTVAEEYPDIRSDHQIIDIGAARVAAQPESLDVVVTLNLYGDILSDVAAQVAGSVGLAGSANIGTNAAMFEAIHGSAPDIAGMGVANPSGLLVAATQMLVYVGLPEYAQQIKNAWLCTLEDGIHTADIYRAGLSEREVGTVGFTDAVIERLGQTPNIMETAQYRTSTDFTLSPTPSEKKELVGVDVFLDWEDGDRDPDQLGAKVETLGDARLPFKMISNRGVKVYPGGIPETFHTDHWRCRFVSDDGEVAFSDVLALLRRVDEAGLDVIKTEHLYTFDGQLGFSLGQGE